MHDPNFKVKENTFFGITKNYGDENINTKERTFKRNAECTLETFESKHVISNSFKVL